MNLMKKRHTRNMLQAAATIMPRFTGCDEEARTVLYILIKQNHIISSTDMLVWLFCAYHPEHKSQVCHSSGGWMQHGGG